MKSLLMPWVVVIPAVRQSFHTLESLLGRAGFRNLFIIMVGVILFWHLYAPIHELFHAGACFLGGGTVRELAIKPQYGGVLLQKVFPFVVPQSEYAGQLTGFSTPNYWVYALVDFAPYLLSLPGVSLVELSRRQSRPLLFGMALILVYTPFMSIPGDYYEGVSLVTTQIAEKMDPDLAPGFLISDDFFKLISQLRETGQLNGRIALLLGLGLVVAVYAALFTLALQVIIATRWFKANLLPSPAGGEPAETSS